MNTDLSRQRRNLIAISTLLLIFDFAQVKVTKVSVLGTELLVGNVKVLMIFAWLLWAYFLLRYYQYWRLEQGQVIRAAFRERFGGHLGFYLNTKPSQDPIGQPFPSYEFNRTGLGRWSYTNRRYNPNTSSVEDGPPIVIPLRRTIAWTLKATAHIALQTPHATDHILPFALAIAAPVVTFYTAYK